MGPRDAVVLLLAQALQALVCSGFTMDFDALFQTSLGELSRAREDAVRDAVQDAVPDTPLRIIEDLDLAKMPTRHVNADRHRPPSSRWPQAGEDVGVAGLQRLMRNRMQQLVADMAKEVADNPTPDVAVAEVIDAGEREDEPKVAKAEAPLVDVEEQRGDGVSSDGLPRRKKSREDQDVEDDVEDDVGDDVEEDITEDDVEDGVDDDVEDDGQGDGQEIKQGQQDDVEVPTGPRVTGASSRSRPGDPSWHHPCGRSVDLTGKGAHLAGQSSGLSRFTRHINKALQKVWQQLNMSVMHYRKQRFEKLYYQVINGVNEEHYIPSWVPGKEDIPTLSPEDIKSSQKLAHQLTKMHTQLQKFSVALEQISQGERHDPLRHTALSGTQTYVRMLLCEVEWALLSLAIPLPDPVPRAIMSEAERNVVDNTNRQVRDWGILLKYRDFLSGWADIVAAHNAQQRGGHHRHRRGHGSTL